VTATMCLHGCAVTCQLLFLSARSKEEFYSLLKDVQAPDTLALYDHRLSSKEVELV